MNESFRAYYCHRSETDDIEIQDEEWLVEESEETEADLWDDLVHLPRHVKMFGLLTFVWIMCIVHGMCSPLVSGVVLALMIHAMFLVEFAVLLCKNRKALFSVMGPDDCKI